MELLLVSFESAAAVRLISPIIQPSLTPTLLSAPENAEAAITPGFFSPELMFELIGSVFPPDNLFT